MKEVWLWYLSTDLVTGHVVPQYHIYFDPFFFRVKKYNSESIWAVKSRFMRRIEKTVKKITRKINSKKESVRESSRPK